jgi:hypothetical protein
VGFRAWHLATRGRFLRGGKELIPTTRLGCKSNRFGGLAGGVLTFIFLQAERRVIVPSHTGDDVCSGIFRSDIGVITRVLAIVNASGNLFVNWLGEMKNSFTPQQLDSV